MNIKNGLYPVVKGSIEGIRGPAGKDGAKTWEELEDKPFESIGSGLSVDSEGVLSSTGGSGGASTWDDLEGKPFESIGNWLYVNDNEELCTDIDWYDVYDKPFEGLGDNLWVDQDSNLCADVANGWSDVYDKPFESIGDNLTVDSEGRLNAEASAPPEIYIGSSTPSGQEVLWINDTPTSVNVPQIDDANISLVDTWSSSKIISEIPQIVALTQEEYDEITPDPNTYYFIYDSESSE